MKQQSPDDVTRQFAEAAKNMRGESYVLRLYVTGTTPRSARAISNIKKICDEHLKGRYSLEVVDLYQQPVLAKGDQILAAPTLIKKLPTPLRTFIGDMSDTEKILVGLDLRPKTKDRNERDPGKRQSSSPVSD